MDQADDLSFWNHVDEMRSTLIRGILVILVASAACFFFANEAVQLLTTPYSQVTRNERVVRLQATRYTNRGTEAERFQLPENAQSLTIPAGASDVWLAPGEHHDYLEPKLPNPLLLLSPIEGFTTALKVSAWLGIILTAPIWGYLVLRFVLPALENGARRTALVLYLLALSFFYSGIAFAFAITLPIATQFLFQFGESFGQNLWGLAAYLEYVITISLANGLAFELCVILGGLVHFGVVSAQALRSKRRHVIVGIFLLSAIITPPDVITQCLVALPLILLYEGTLFFAKWSQAREQTPHLQEGSV